MNGFFVLMPRFRALFLADAGFLAVELALILGSAQLLFPAVRHLWLPAGVAVLVIGGLLISGIGRLGLPLAVAGSSFQRPRRGEEAAATRLLSRLAVESLWLRVAVLIAISALLGAYGARLHELPREAVAYLLWTAALLTPLVDAWRALLYDRLAQRFLARMASTRPSSRLPALSVAALRSRYAIDTYQVRMFLRSLAMLGAAMAGSAGFLFLSQPDLIYAIRSRPEILKLMYFAPLAGIALLALLMLSLRRSAAPLDRWLATVRADPNLAEVGPPPLSADDPALRTASRLPILLACGKLTLVAIPLAIVAASHGGQTLLLGEILLCFLAAAYIEWPWQKALLFPLLGTSRRPLSLRGLLLPALAVPMVISLGLLALQAERSLRWLLAAYFLGWAGCILMLLRWSGTWQKGVRAATAGAVAVANGNPTLPEGLAEGSPLREALLAMQTVLDERLVTSSQAQAQLEAEVAERTLALRRRNHDLEEALRLLSEAQAELLAAEKLASIGRLVAGIAHEINNPVNAVLNTAYPLREALQDLGKHLPSPGQPVDATTLGELRQMLSVLERGGRRAQEIVAALHSYAHGGSEVATEFTIPELLDGAIELVQHPFKAQVELLRNYDVTRPFFGLFGPLQQVFVNLLGNALHALAEHMAIEPTLRPRIEISAEQSVDELSIRVRDNGTGIAESVLPRIFDPFFTTRDATQGSGLGLSIVHGIVRRHHGQIHVESTAGQGSCFTVVLPVAALTKTAE